MEIQLSDKQFRIIETVSRYLLVLAVIAFIMVAIDTAAQIQELKTMVNNGNCTALAQEIELRKIK